jgi:hypothetical protein
MATAPPITAAATATMTAPTGGKDDEGDVTLTKAAAKAAKGLERCVVCPYVPVRVCACVCISASVPLSVCVRRR